LSWLSGSEADSYFKKGIKLNRKGQYEEAIQIFQHGIDCEKGHSDCWFGMGEAFSGLKKYIRAEECYAHAIEINPDNDEYLIRNAINLRNIALLKKDPLMCFESIKICNRVLLRNEDFNQALHVKGLALWTLNKREEAISLFDKALKRDRNYDYPYDLKGRYLYDLRKYNDAIRYYEIALKKDPKNLDLLMAEGRCLLKIGAYNVAIKCFNLVIRQCSDDPVPFVLLGHSYKGLKQFDKCIEAYEQAMELNPDNRSYRMYIADVYLIQGNNYLYKFKDPHTAINYFNKSLTMVPRYSAAWFSKSIAFRKIGQYRNSLSSMLKVTELDPDNAHAYYEMGKTLKYMDKEDEAIDCYLQAIRIDPTYTEAMYILGNILLQAGRADEAISYFNLIIEKEPHSSTAWYAKGKALKLKNQIREANICFERAGKIATSN